ncbi:MAG: Fur family transcriptional regulator [Mobilitalea sp.]
MESQRNTKQKQLILSMLKESDRPMSINEIYAQVVFKLPKIAKSTIYRNIDSLLGQNLIDKYHLNDNEIFYRIKADSTEHKHFVICDDCKKVFDLPSCPIHALENAMEEEGFIIKEHQIQISGICKACAKNVTKE